jgi:hypothetical protein
MKLIDPELSKPALAMDDAGKDDYGSELDPLSCTASNGECSVANVPVDAADGKPPKSVTLNVPGGEVKGYNVRASGGALAEARRRFGSLIGDNLALAGVTYLTLFTDQAGVAAIQKSANAQPGIQVQENKCRKEKPGPPVELLDAFPVLPADPLPVRRIRLRP